MKVFEHEWILERFEGHRSFFTKRMFGGLAAYLFERQMLLTELAPRVVEREVDGGEAGIRNRLAYGLNNIVANPRVGLIFMVPGTTETLRVNGSAELRSDPELLERLEARGKPAVLVIKVTVEECFFHCSKAFIRSKLWKHETWPEKQKISFGTMLAKRLKSDDPDLPGLIDAGVEEDARTNL